MFSLFLFYMVEQNVVRLKHSNYFALVIPVNDPANSDNLITEDTEVNAEDALNSITPPLLQYPIAHKIVIANKKGSLLMVIQDHWEPPKLA